MPRRIFRLDCEYIMLPLMPASVQVMLMFPWCMGLLFPAHAWWIILLWPAGFSSAKNPFYFSCLLTGLRLVHAGIGITEESSKSFAAKLSVGRQHQTVLVCMLPKASCWCCNTAHVKDLIRSHCQRQELRLEACDSVMVCVCNVDLLFTTIRILCSPRYYQKLLKLCNRVCPVTFCAMYCTGVSPFPVIWVNAGKSSICCQCSLLLGVFLSYRIPGKKFRRLWQSHSSSLRNGTKP